MRLRLFWLSCALALCGCDGKDTPKINPHPTYFVTISGHIDPHLKAPVYLGFWASYAGYSQHCEKTANILAGTKKLPGKTKFFPAKTNAEGNYEVKIPVDLYLPGYCDWKIANIITSWQFKKPLDRNSWKKTGVQSVMSFGNINNEHENPSLPSKKINTAILCKNKSSFCGGALILAGYVNNVPRNKNYTLTQNIEKK